MPKQKRKVVNWRDYDASLRQHGSLTVWVTAEAIEGNSQCEEMFLMSFDTKRVNGAPDAIAPDGSEVRVLCRTGRGSMAQFVLPPGAVSHAVAHRTVEELWCFIAGRGRMWRRFGDRDEVVGVGPGISVSILAGTHFQFRCSGDGDPLVAVGVTMPPWPGEAEAYAVEGYWSPTSCCSE